MSDWEFFQPYKHDVVFQTPPVHAQHVDQLKSDRNHPDKGYSCGGTVQVFADEKRIQKIHSLAGYIG